MSVSRSKSARHARPRGGSIAFYDLDGTLVDLNLVHATLFILANLGEWSNRVAYLASFITRVPRIFMAEQRDRRLLNEEMYAVFRNVSHSRLRLLGEEYCERVLIKHLYPRAIEMLEANRAAGIEPVLVTGSPDFVVEPLAHHLGIADFAANRFIFRGGRATGRLAEPIMASDEKADWCEEFAAARGIDLKDCWGYADSHYDLAFLAALGHPVCVNPDRRLRAAASSRNWPVLYFEKNTDDERDEFDAVLTSLGEPDGAS
jgi:alcohol-forming fatty acyl-CoA reductase